MAQDMAQDIAQGMVQDMAQDMAQGMLLSFIFYLLSNATTFHFSSAKPFHSHLSSLIFHL